MNCLFQNIRWHPKVGHQGGLLLECPVKQVDHYPFVECSLLGSPLLLIAAVSDGTRAPGIMLLLFNGLLLCGDVMIVGTRLKRSGYL